MENGKAIGMLEYSTVTQGMLAADLLLKAAKVSIIKMRTTCPGKYIIVFTGGLADVRESLHIAKSKYPDRLIGHFLLGNPSTKVLIAFSENTRKAPAGQSVGIIETYTASSVITAADAAAKAADIEILEIRLAREMCGKSFALICGQAAESEEAVSKACEAAGDMLLDAAVIHNPTGEFIEAL